MTKESLRRDVPSSFSTIKLPRNIILQKPKPFIMAPTYQFFPDNAEEWREFHNTEEGLTSLIVHAGARLQAIRSAAAIEVALADY